jgi:hypothetical protein
VIAYNVANYTAVLYVVQLCKTCREWLYTERKTMHTSIPAVYTSSISERLIDE